MAHFMLLNFPSAFRDRCRTMANVMGDSIGAGLVQHLSRHELATYDDPETPEVQPNGVTSQEHLYIESQVL